MPTATQPGPRLRPGSIPRTISAMAEGQVVVLIDDGNSGEAALILAAERATPSTLAFMVRHSSGFICAALPAADCERLHLPPGWAYSENGQHVSVDHSGPGTGISARDRAHTLATLADPAAVPADFSRPGHVVPVSVRPSGMPDSASREEASIDLSRLAGLRPVVAIGAMVSIVQPTQMAHRHDAMRFATRHHLTAVPLHDIVALHNAQ